MSARTTIRITWVRVAGAYRIDEVGGDGVVRTEISPAVVNDEGFAEYLAALVAGHRRLVVSRGAIDDDRAGSWSTRPPGSVGGGS